MKPSLCRCGARAEYSVCVLVSTLGLRLRRQKCGRGQAFCSLYIDAPVGEMEHGRSQCPGIAQGRVYSDC